MLVSSIDLIALVMALELTSFPLYFLVAMRRERPGQRVQMESAIKYMIFGITATGVMLFGMSYLFGLTGTTSSAHDDGGSSRWCTPRWQWPASP